MKLFCKIYSLLASCCKNSNVSVSVVITAEIVMLKSPLFLELFRGFVALIWDYALIASGSPREIYPNIMY